MKGGFMARSKWTEDKIKFLIDNYNNMPIDKIAENLNVSKWTIYDKVKELGIGKKFKWTKDKIEILKEYYPIGDWNILFEKLGTNNKQCIMDKACSLGIHMDNYKWTQQDEQYLIDNYNKLTVFEIAKYLNRTESAIMTKAYKLDVTNPNIWTNEEVELLKELYPIHSNKYLSKNIFKGKQPATIRAKASSLGLHKSKEKGLKKYYDKDLILQQLKDVAKEIGHTPLYSELCSLGLPSEKTFDRLFGSYRKAVKEAELPINAKLWGKSIARYALNGELCYSTSELVITDFLISHNISYIKEPLYKDYINDDRCKFKRADWKVGDYFIEYFGLTGMSEYDKKTKEKIKICQDNNIKLIEIYPNDMFNLEEKLKVLLN